MTDRFIIAAAIIALIVVIGVLARYWDRYRCRRIESTESFERPADGRPQIVSFFGQNCGACDKQKRIIAELQSSRPVSASVRYIDAAAESSLALRYGVMVVPTTLIVASTGQIVSMTTGLLPLERLESVLDQIA
ncbi:MAG: thioredoxin family protein [Thermomicrobiales bacterium]